jgi:hypothetical protein
MTTKFELNPHNHSPDLLSFKIFREYSFDFLLPLPGIQNSPHFLNEIITYLFCYAFVLHSGDKT